jgi:glycolate oxidase iron-sulfur subunit
MHLVDHARAYIEQTYKRPLPDRALRALLRFILPHRERFRLAAAGAILMKPLRPFIAGLPVLGPRLAAMIDLAPTQFPARAVPEIVSVQGAKRGRVIILEGCAQPVLKPSINAATRRLLARNGIEAVDVKGEGCCGALVHHMGQEHDALAFARRNIDLWLAEADRGGLDAILITASGCGTTVKDYGFMFRDDAAYAQKAARVSALAKDISEYLVTLELKPARETGQVLAYHSACSMQHGQQLREEPKRLLKAMGFVVKDVPEGHICCGSAGTYNMLQPEIAGQLKARKLANIARTKPMAVATGNIGCMTQLSSGTGVPVVHTVEFVDWANGGPMPEPLAQFGFLKQPEHMMAAQ